MTEHEVPAELGDQLTVAEAVKLARIGKSKLYELMDRGALGSYRLDGSRRVSRRSLAAYLAAHYIPAAPARNAAGSASGGETPQVVAGDDRSAAGLAAALDAAVACVESAWELTELIRAYDPASPIDPDWRHYVLCRAEVALAQLYAAVVHGYERIQPMVPMLERAAPERLVIRLPADPSAGCGPWSLAETTAHGTVLAVADCFLRLAWRAADREDYLRFSLPRNGLARFDPIAVAGEFRRVWPDLAGLLPEVDENALLAACRREAARAAPVGVRLRDQAAALDDVVLVDAGAEASGERAAAAAPAPAARKKTPRATKRGVRRSS